MWERYASGPGSGVPHCEPSAGGAAGSSTLATLLAFGPLAVVGADVAGSTVDRPGRTTVTSASTLTSGGARIAAGYLLGSSRLMLVLFVLVWGFAIVAASARCSICVTALAEERYVSTALSLQTAIRCLLTTVSIQLVPVFVDVVAWQWAVAPLTISPGVGALDVPLAYASGGCPARRRAGVSGCRGCPDR